MAIPVPVVDETGLHLPSFTDVRGYLENEYRRIYGNDIYLEDDSQDGELIGVFTAAINDAYAAMFAVYQSFSPSSAQGVPLSRVVKINGIKRKAPTYSTVDVLIEGQFGVEIVNGIVSDVNSNNWILPSLVTIPSTGQITVTATAQDIGAIPAGVGTVTNIETPTPGWQSVTNASIAIIGAPIEFDAQLRLRQTQSTAMPAQTTLDTLYGAIAAVPGVEALRIYENTTGYYDENGMPGHSIGVVVLGGDVAAIGAVLTLKKGTGVDTYGEVPYSSFDAHGVPRTVHFMRPVFPTITWEITLRAKTGYTVTIEESIRQAMAAWTNLLEIGEDVVLNRAYVAANLTGAIANKTYEILEMSASRDAQPLVSNDISIAFNEQAKSSAVNVTINVVPA